MGVDLYSFKARTLRDAMLAARDALRKAEDSYENALHNFAETRGTDGSALQQVGAAYAHAVLVYDEAVMKWLLFIDAEIMSSRRRGASAE